MNFLDLDFGELKLGKPVEEMTPTEILKYGDFMFEEQFGYKMPIEWPVETIAMRKFVKTYGSNAGKIVKWIFYQHHGRNIDGDPISMSYFNSKLKWISDKYYNEMMQATHQQASVGFINVKDFVRMAEENAPISA